MRTVFFLIVAGCATRRPPVVTAPRPGCGDAALVAMVSAEVGGVDVQLRTLAHAGEVWLVNGVVGESCGVRGCLDQAVFLAQDADGCSWRNVLDTSMRLSSAGEPASGPPHLWGCVRRGAVDDGSALAEVVYVFDAASGRYRQGSVDVLGSDERCP